MTFREKLRKEHPNKISAFAGGGCEGCPEHYGYEERTICSNMVDCTACWDREITGTEAQNSETVNPAPKAQKPELVNSAPKRRPVAYISGPITGIANYWEAFEEAEDELTAAGFIPLSPARLPQGMTEAQYMTINLAMLNSADAVYFLPRYNASKGAMVEYRYAEYVGKPNSGDIETLKEVFGL